MNTAKVKMLLASLLRASGYFAVRSRIVTHNRAAIFMYHRVLPQKYLQETDFPVEPGMYVSPASLRLHLTYLKKHFSLISLGELVRRMRAGENISRCAVLTFDDGWLDNYLYAFPILQELKTPAIIFLTSGFVGTSQRFWPEEIGRTIFLAHRKMIDISSLPDALAGMMKGESSQHNDVTEIIGRIVAEMKSWEEPKRFFVTKSCAQLREKTEGKSKRLLMNWDEVREMTQSGLVTVGCHTVSHALLDQLPLEKVKQEVAESAAQIQQETGVSTDLFAYPNGNYTPGVLSVLSNSGMTAAVTTRRGFVNENTPLLELPRISVHEDISHTQALFQWRLLVR